MVMGFRRLLSSIGIGAAKVETRLESSDLAPGDEVHGVVEIIGGDSDTEIDGIRLEVQTYYKRESGDDTVTETGTIERFQVAGHTVVKAKNREELPFSFALPYDTPLTLGRSSVWVRTSLDVKMAMDPSDSDAINVRPTATQQKILDAFKRLEFIMREADNEDLPHRLRRNLPFAQEFEFVARGGEFRGQFDEIEMVMFPSSDSVDVVLQMDRRARGLGSFFSEQMGTDESYAGLTISGSQDLDSVADAIADNIRRHA
jgi:sporulation-control protein